MVVNVVGIEMSLVHDKAFPILDEVLNIKTCAHIVRNISYVPMRKFSFICCRTVGCLVYDQ